MYVHGVSSKRGGEHLLHLTDVRCVALDVDDRELCISSGGVRQTLYQHFRQGGPQGVPRDLVALPKGHRLRGGVLVELEERAEVEVVFVGAAEELPRPHDRPGEALLLRGGLDSGFTDGLSIEHAGGIQHDEGEGVASSHANAGHEHQVLERAVRRSGSRGPPSRRRDHLHTPRIHGVWRVQAGGGQSRNGLFEVEAVATPSLPNLAAHVIGADAATRPRLGRKCSGACADDRGSRATQRALQRLWRGVGRRACNVRLEEPDLGAALLAQKIQQPLASGWATNHGMDRVPLVDKTKDSEFANVARSTDDGDGAALGNVQPARSGRCTRARTATASNGQQPGLPRATAGEKCGRCRASP
mmetsp:Transcript_35414/g.91473  ORF Transcript_35414/g.91473 Transcript_35414/m.91473 type:complete len:358 (+) Transcript_35414:6-1079(+)